MLGAIRIDAHNLRRVDGHRGIDRFPVGVLYRNLLKRWWTVRQATLQVGIGCQLGRIDGGKQRVKRNRRAARVCASGRRRLRLAAASTGLKRAIGPSRPSSELKTSCFDCL